MENKDAEKNQTKGRHPVKKSTLGLMLIFAGIADAASFLLSFTPIIGQVMNGILAFLVILTLWLWFAFAGLGVRAALWGGAGMGVSIIPVLQALPLFIAIVLTVYIRSRIEEVVPITPKKGRRKSTRRAHAPSV